MSSTIMTMTTRRLQRPDRPPAEIRFLNNKCEWYLCTRNTNFVSSDINSVGWDTICLLQKDLKATHVCTSLYKRNHGGIRSHDSPSSVGRYDW
jgi:hypothetical protein